MIFVAVKMIKLNNLQFILFFITLTLLQPSPRLADDEPPFPLLLDPERLDQSSVHIVTESMSDNDGRETIEEYVDFIEGKNTFVKGGSMGHSVKHLDATRNIIFHYKPYECFSMTLEEFNANGMEEIWKAKVSFRYGNSARIMHLFGVAAIWLNAAKMPKKFVQSTLIYSASRDIYSPALTWVIEDRASQQDIELFFIQSNPAKGISETRLEVIKFKSTKTNETTRTLNILEVNHVIDSSTREILLQLPVGYGCIDESVTEKSQIEYRDLSDFKLNDILNAPHRIGMEITYTNYGKDSFNEPVSETLNVQLSRNIPIDKNEYGFLQLIRQRDTYHDFKTVTHHKFNVEYNIDYRAGSCKISHLDDETNVKERLMVKFSDKVEFDADLFDLQKLFGHNEDKDTKFYFVKQVRSSENISSQYYETTLNRFNDKMIRFVRVYTLDEESGDMNLDYITAYVFNDKRDHIVASYQFNLIEVRRLIDLTEISSLFDVSEECYLNNQEMQVNRDYAWFQVEYPLQSRMIAKLSNIGQRVKTAFYNSLFSSTHLTFFRIPKIELIFTETGLTIRALLIDLPRLHILFRNKPKSRLSSATKPEVEIDVDHCAELCELNRCKVMSYCEQSHICSMKDDTSQQEIVTVPEQDGCTTYFAPDYYYKEEINRLSLHGYISELQHQDYDMVSLPKIPEELIYLDSDTEVDASTRLGLMTDYLGLVEKYISAASRLPTMTFSITFDGILAILLPSGFLLEEDPMKGFNLNIKDASEYPDFVQPFHQGIVMKKFSKTILSTELAPRYRANLFKGLTYNQCTMACTDSRCSSFSYCEDTQECLITDIYNISNLKEENMITDDSRCFISQRDFLSKFNKFPNLVNKVDLNFIKELNHIKLTMNVLNPSECAHSCVIETDLGCLSFDFCRKGGETFCVFYNDRQVHFGTTDQSLVAETSSSNTTLSGSQTAGDNSQCDHYTRSYLADFIRIESRRLKEEELAKVKTSSMEGVSVYKCAEECVNQLVDCSAFQFCLEPSQSISKGFIQSCIFIESRPAMGSDAKEFSVTLNETDGRVLKAGRFFEVDGDCQVFSLRKDSTEAQVRELALVGVDMNHGDSDGSESRLGSHIFSYVLLYIGLTLVFTTLGYAFLVVGQRNEYLRQKIERFQILLNM